MAEDVPATDLLASGREALSRGAWSQARSRFEAALVTGESAQALEGLSWAVWWLEDVTACLDARERAYRCYRLAGDARGAARMALWLGDDHLEFLGAEAVAAGWFRRADRILEGLESCPEHGWRAVFQAHAAIGRQDLTRGRDLAAQARTIGRRHGAVDLEMFALASEGVARVEQGEVAEGLGCLDEATAAALGGEYENLAPAAWACCLLMSACERVRDYDRGAQWCERIEEFSRRMDARFVHGVCRAHYGVILAWRGRWQAAERELVAALDDLTFKRPSWRSEALVRLGELRRRQGRLDDATAAFEQAVDHPLALRGLAALSLDSGDAVTAGDLLERALRHLPHAGTVGRADVLELLVRSAVMTGHHDVAADRLEELRAIVRAAQTASLRAAVCLAEGVITAAAGDHQRARAHLEDAVDLFGQARAPVEAARARTELAVTLAGLGRIPAARREARLALAALTDVGAGPDTARARALVERLDAGTGGRDAPLTPRQVEVLRLVAEGLSNQQIAARLTLSAHTVHRHVANIHRRLGCSSRAAAVAEAGRLGLL